MIDNKETYIMATSESIVKIDETNVDKVNLLLFISRETWIDEIKDITSEETNIGKIINENSLFNFTNDVHKKYNNLQKFINIHNYLLNREIMYVQKPINLWYFVNADFEFDDGVSNTTKGYYYKLGLKYIIKFESSYLGNLANIMKFKHIKFTEFRTIDVISKESLNGEAREKIVGSILFKLLLVIKQLEEANIIHNNLTTDSIFIKKYNLKEEIIFDPIIGEWSNAFQFTNSKDFITKYAYSGIYRAPEIIYHTSNASYKSSPYIRSGKEEIFTLGVLLYQLFMNFDYLNIDYKLDIKLKGILNDMLYPFAFDDIEYLLNNQLNATEFAITKYLKEKIAKLGINLEPQSLNSNEVETLRETYNALLQLQNLDEDLFQADESYKQIKNHTDKDTIDFAFELFNYINSNNFIKTLKTPIEETIPCINTLKDIVERHHVLYKIALKRPSLDELLNRVYTDLILIIDGVKNDINEVSFEDYISQLRSKYAFDKKIIKNDSISVILGNILSLNKESLIDSCTPLFKNTEKRYSRDQISNPIIYKFDPKNSNSVWNPLPINEYCNYYSKKEESDENEEILSEETELLIV